MKFKSLKVQNFRNFKSINLDLSNKNVIFGMNDTGKTNLLHAIRFLLDRDVRKKGFSQSDYYKNDVTQDIEIILEISLSDRKDNTPESEDSKYLISKVKNARNNDDNLDQFFIKLTAAYDEQELYGNPVMSWGDCLEKLIPIPGKGEVYDLDKIFKVVYLEPLVDLDNNFKRYKRILFNQEKKSENDVKIENEIESNIRKMNEGISNLDVVKTVQNKLTDGYRTFKKENLNIELKSQIMIDGYLDNLIPYVKWDEDDKNYYPTGGDGRKKILSYAITNYAIECVYNSQIVIYLIEEPENSLHRSMQISLSQQLFNQEIYRYFFLTTHSAEILYEMDETQLIRISNKNQKNSHSYLYRVPKEYKNAKKKLNKGLSNALFYEKVLLVEGGSEYVLFEAVLSYIAPDYEQQGSYLMQVDGINFKPYIDLFKELGIKWIVKTDNDLKAKRGHPHHFDLIGMNRCLQLLGEDKMEYIRIDYDASLPKKEKEILLEQKLYESKKDIYSKNTDLIKRFNENMIFLSEVDLETDLFNAIPDDLKKMTDEEDPVSWLQSSKLLNMVELVGLLNEEIANRVYESIPALKELINYGA